MMLKFGVYECFHYPGSSRRCEFEGNKPPVDIFIDYGDGSPIATWTKDQPKNIWRHKYSNPGNYVVTATGMYKKHPHRCSVRFHKRHTL